VLSRRLAQGKVFHSVSADYERRPQILPVLFALFTVHLQANLFGPLLPAWPKFNSTRVQ